MIDARAVAIVGIGCRFPGGVNDHRSFWNLLREGRDAIGDIPADRIDLHRHYDPKPTVGKTVSRFGGYLDRIDAFDASFFGISPREAERMDPQQRLLLETAWESLEDAGIDVNALDGAPAGVFVGQWTSDFEWRIFADPAAVDFQMTLGSGRYAASGRIAYALGLMGPSLTIDTACSSSLAAVHLATQSLRSGEVELALAGGVNVILAPHVHIAYSQSGMMAPDGRCKFGAARADGYVRSEGAAIVVLKRLIDAQRDGDRIHAVIRGSAINNDGRTSGSMGTPSRIGQEQLLRRAYVDAGVAAEQVGYVEAHGTGTRAGDKVEIGALAKVLAPSGRDAPLMIGSVKTNIGHTEGAAGIAGLIKAALVLREREIPPSLHLDVPNPDIPWTEASVMVPQQRISGSHSPAFAGVSAFGIAGANAHVVLERAPEKSAIQEGRPAPVLTLSARGEAGLRALAGRVAEFLRADEAPSLEVICAHSQMHRTGLSHRAAFVALDRETTLAALDAFVSGAPAAAFGVADSKRPAKVAFVCPGQGGQWEGMARSLLASEPAFAQALDRCDADVRSLAGWSLREQLAKSAGDAEYRLSDIDVVQPTLASLAIAYAELFSSYGLEADAVVGHSMGEASAACIAKAITENESLRIVCRRSALMHELRGRGAMALVDAAAETVAPRLAEFPGISIAAINSPRSCVISGDVEGVRVLVGAFEAEGIFAREVKVDVASHSPQMATPAVALRAALADLAPRPEERLFVSSVLGRQAAGTELDASYWARNLREPVRFADAIGALLDQDVAAFVELGPHPTLAPSIEQTAAAREREAVVVACGRRDESERESFFTALARLWCAGATVNWRRAVPHALHVEGFPLYPWQRQRHWVEAAELANGIGGTQPRRGPDEEERRWLYGMAWRQIAVQAPATAAARWVVVGEAGPLVSALQARGALVECAPLTSLETVLRADVTSDVAIVVPGGEEAPYLPIRAAQALSLGAKRRLWFLTHDAQATEGVAPVDVDHAALWGAARVLGEERPDAWGGLLDLPGGAATEQDVACAADLLLAARGEDQIAVREGKAFVQRLTTTPSPMGTVARWRTDGAYFLSGGLGDVGLHVARAMADEGARRLILASRSGLPPRSTWREIDPASPIGKRVAGVRALEARGMAVHTPTLDVADEAALKRFLAEYESEGWPPIQGVIHLAAVFENCLTHDMGRNAFDAVLSGKLRGAQALDRAFPDVETFVLFSSLGAFLPQPGQANYAAANAGLDALAVDRQARGRSGLSIGWGVWADAGLVGNAAGEINTAEMARRGIDAIEGARAAKLFAWAAGRSEPHLVVAPVDWGRYAEARAGRTEPLLTELKGKGFTGSLSERLEHATVPERRMLIASAIIGALAQTLKLPPDQIESEREFGALGLTSLLAMELRNRLESLLGRPLPATMAWNYPTVPALAAHLAGEAIKPRLQAKRAPVDSTAAAERVAAVSALSDADAFAALRRRGKGIRS